MRTIISAVIVLLLAALVIACSQDKEFEGAQKLNAPGEGSSEAALLATQTGPDAGPPVPGADAFVESTPDPDADVASALGVLGLSKQGESLFVASVSGLYLSNGASLELLAPGYTVASLQAHENHWVVQEGMLRTLDGSTQIVPDAACAFSAAVEHEGVVFVGTQGEGVWTLAEGALVPVSPPWIVTALVSTDFGLFAATDVGLFSFRDDRWHRRRLSDSSSVLAAPQALYYRYPYLYVGAETEVVRFDGGNWDRFAIGATVSALGWHNARLYIGSAEGFLYTLEGAVLEEVPSPQVGPVRALLRFDGRLHVGTDDGLYRYRHARFEKIAGQKPTESEPETEPIASLL